MLNEINRISSSSDLLHNEAEVEAAIDEMAKKINSHLKHSNPVFLSVMNGGVVISGKLMTRLNFPLTFDAINVSRYNNKTSGGTLHWKQKPETILNNRTVLIVDDILDKGMTLEAIVNYCKDQGASAVYTAVLIDKTLDHKKPVKADFVGLEVENRYLYGYGMDYKGYLRNAAGIYACKED